MQVLLKSSFKNAAPASWFIEKPYKVNLQNLCQSELERFMPAFVADKQNEGKFIFFVVLQSYHGPEASLVTSFIICVKKKIIRWKRNTFQAIRSPFSSKCNSKKKKNKTRTKPNNNIQFNFIPCVMTGTNPLSRKLPLAISRTNSFPLIQLT